MSVLPLILIVPTAAGLACLIGSLLGLVAGYVTEQADLRSWESLPDNFQILRVSVPAGDREMEIHLQGPGIISDRIALGDVPVQAGRVTLINLRSMGVRGTAKYASF